MIYSNPILKGFYPDPSVCFANGKFYLVTSSFQYFPGVPLFESSDLVNWTQIGHVLSRESQLPLNAALSSAGIFAPTIRYNNGTFYMVTTNTTTCKNFYVTTNDIHGEWSEPICVEQDGIDPSLYFEYGHAYFMSNGSDDYGDNGITQCEIDIATGKKLSPSKTIWHGSGGRYLESPHLYKIGDYYYLMAAEGGTEYGHMITYARSRSLWENFEEYPENPVLTNRNLGGFTIQGIGHGDLIQKPDTGEWFILSLGFRQIDQWMPFHHLGREIFLTPVSFNKDGWFMAGTDGTTSQTYEIQGDFQQNTDISGRFGKSSEWIYLRNPDMSRYELSDKKFVLHGSNVTLNDIGSPVFIGIRQRDFNGKLTCSLTANGGEAGISVFMDENHHYDLGIRKCESGYEAFIRIKIGSSENIRKIVKTSDNHIGFNIDFNNFCYCFSAETNDNTEDFGIMETRYLSSEVALGFTGVIFGLYAVNEGSSAEFSDFSIEYND